MAARVRSQAVPVVSLNDADHVDPAATSAATIGFPFRLLLVFAILPILLGASGLAVYRQQQGDLIYPRVSILEVDVGYKSREAAAQAVKAYLQSQSRRNLLLRSPDDAISVSLGTVGVIVDDDEIRTMVERAWNVGRESQLQPWLRAQLNLLRSGHQLPVALRIDKERATAVLARVAVDVEHPTVNASFSVERAGNTFEVHTSPAHTGTRLNVNATLDRLQKSLVNALPAAVDLVIDQAPPGLTDADVQPAVDTVRNILGTPLEFRAGTRNWKLEPPAAFDMLEIKGLEASRPPVSAQLNDTKLRAFVEKLAREADQAAKNPTLDMAGDQVVVRPGTPGRRADAEATFRLARERVLGPDRALEVVFAEDKPWLTEADLEQFRVEANTLLSLPITLEAPQVPLAQDRKWVLDRALLSQMLVMPNTQTAPREYATLPSALRPRFDVQLDSGKVTNYLAREVAPWVSDDPLDAELRLRAIFVDVPNPAAGAASTTGTSTPTGTIREGTVSPTPDDPARGTLESTVPATIRETRYVVELKNARDGRGPDYLGTFVGMQVLFRSAQPADPAERRVLVRLAARTPGVTDAMLLPIRDLGNVLIGEPVTVRALSTSYTVTRPELADMLRFPNARDSGSAYLARDVLLARVGAIAAEIQRRGDTPRDAQGRPQPVDVPATAAALWQRASDLATNRVIDVVWLAPDLPEQDNP